MSRRVSGPVVNNVSFMTESVEESCHWKEVEVHFPRRHKTVSVVEACPGNKAHDLRH